MKTKISIAIFLAFYTFFNTNVYSQAVVPGSSTTVLSPNKNLVVNFYQKQDNAGYRKMYYRVEYKGKPVINESALGLQQNNGLSEKAMNLKVDAANDWCSNLSVVKTASISHDTTWVQANGENSQIRDHYNETTISLVKDDNPVYPMDVKIRAYNEGVAICYFFPENLKGSYNNVSSENTEFTLPEGTQAWFANWAQAAYSKLPLKNWPGEAERPLTLELPNGLYVSLAEAAMVDYARGKFKLSPNKPNTITTSMYGEAQLVSPVSTPLAGYNGWRKTG